MPKAFSLASWNVEHFKGKPSRAAKIVDYLKYDLGSPDIFALYEVEGKDTFRALTSRMPGYQFHITEGRQTQEILVGVKQGLTAFFTQKVSFKSSNSYLRPGAFLTVTIAAKNYSILFLHTKSLPTPVGFGLRDDIMERAFKLKRKLDKAAGGRNKARFMFLGDLNTMGLEYPYDADIGPDLELKRIDGRASRNGMRRLVKSAPYTFWNGPGSSYPKSDLDHVVATRNAGPSIRLPAWANDPSVAAADIRLQGWMYEPTAAKAKAWIDGYSDHAALCLEVMK